MSHLPEGPRKFLASAMLAAAVAGMVSGESLAQDAVDGAARDWERRSAEAQRSRRIPAERHRRMEQARAHGQMPDTLYASTPDPSPPHPFLLDADAESTPESSPAGDPARSATRLGYRVGLFPAASRWTGERGYQGFARVINRSDEAGEVRIDAWDEGGTHRGPVMLAIGAGETRHFNSEDLEAGNKRKGLSGGIDAGEGDWRLEFASGLDIEVLSYIRTNDGFLTAMHDVTPSGESGHRVVTFNPGRNRKQVSRLRVVNPGAEAAEVRIEGIDDAGASSDGAVELTLAPGASRMLTAGELESGEAQGLSGPLGAGTGKWRLLVTSEQPIEVMSLMWSPTGHLTNLSTAPANAEPDAGGAGAMHAVGLFPSASDAMKRQGFVRVVNRSDEPGEVQIDAWDEAGKHAGPATLAIGAGETKHFNSEDLETGNAGKGLDGATGSGEGDWRLALASPLELQVLSYIRTEDGFLTAMHDVAPATGTEHRVVTFNPGKNADQVSWLRLVNPSDGPAEVTIEGVDDEGASPGGAVELTLAAQASRTLTARELESGEAQGLSGPLGTGKGKWRLTVKSEQPVEVMSLLSSPTGHLTNLSTVPNKVELGVVETAEEFFREHISGPIVQGKCIGCHVNGGFYPGDKLVFVGSSAPGHEAHNLQVFKDFVADVPDGAQVVLAKIRGERGHGGGRQVARGTPDYENMERFLRLLGEDITPTTLTPRTLFDTVKMAPARKTLRRAALILAGRIPADAEYAAAQGGTQALRSAIRGLMTGPEFHEFLIRGANDRLLTNRAGQVIDFNAGHFVDFANETYRRKAAARANGDQRDYTRYYLWNDRTQHGVRRAPLELIAYVVENDLPYTEVLTADYIMANPWSAVAYGASTRFDDPEDVHEFKRSEIVSYYRKGEGYESEFDCDVDGERVLDPGPLITDYPHAGILNTAAFLYRYPTTATNRNRARSRWTWYHFLGFDIEKSASRTTDPVALADTDNPTMFNPACTVCHVVLDPMGGTFQNYGDEGFYKDKWGGLDSIDDYYRNDAPNALEVRADSSRNRQTLSWTLPLAAGDETLKVIFANDFWDERTREDGQLFLDRLTVTDADGRPILRREFEDLETPVAHWGNCGEPRRDHFLLWGGYTECAFYIDVSVPGTGLHDVEVVAWSNGRYEQYGEGGYARLSVAAHAYQPGDTWYRDMRVPGFGGVMAPDSDNSVQWVARKIVADDRFAEATVKFWWPAIMGSEVAEPPEDEDAADFEGLLLAANAQAAEVERLARGFRRGFHGGPAYNLKDLLVEIVLSKWFRADAVEDDDPVRRVALRDAGARRLLTPEELSRKTAALTGVEWGRSIKAHCWPECSQRPSALTEQFRLLYGGIDSDGIPERARDLTSVMAGVAKSQATQMACPIIMREFFLLPDSERWLFSGIDRNVTPVSEFSATFEIESRSRARRETLSLSGELPAGSIGVRMAYTNDYWGGENADRNVYLDRLVLRNAAGRVVASRELERLGPSGDCNGASGEDYALRCGGSVEAALEVPAARSYRIEVVAWAEQAGDELPRLTVTVETDTESSGGASAIRGKLVELHEKLLGVRVTPHSPDVEAAYRLFVDVWERKFGSEDADTHFRSRLCDWWRDIHLFDGILDDVVVERENEDGWRWYEYDGARVHAFMDGIDWVDERYAAQTWMVVLAYLMMDYRYLYL